MIPRKFHLGLLCLLIFYGNVSAKYYASIEEEEREARYFLYLLDKQSEKNANRLTLASWAYDSNMTDENFEKQLAISAEVAKKEKESWQKLLKFNWENFSDPELARQFGGYSMLGTAALSEEKFERLETIVNDMETIYSKAKIKKPYKKRKTYRTAEDCQLSLVPDIVDIFATSKDPEELKYTWLEWRNEIGPKCRELYEEYVELSNEASRLNDYADMSEEWLDDYEGPNFQNVIQNLWEQLRPLYLQIHAYVRTNLRKIYPGLIRKKGPIPAHLLGNLWAQSWRNIAESMLPYPDVKSPNLTAVLRKQNYTATKIFRTAEDFFKSINLTEMPETFWTKSILEKPADRDIVCHASAWDFNDGKDYRIKQCTQITGEHFVTAHHEMGHIEYFLQYKHQPYNYRQGANHGFQEAIGDLISLSVESTKHLKKIGLLPNEKDDPKQVLNNLFMLGFDKITFLPFGYLMDLWRWDVFSGKTKPEDYNCKWWKLREKYQGVEPPVDRSEEDFDPAAKYHIIAGEPYLGYFVSFVLQYQFHRALCTKAGQYEPNNPKKQLHECDIYENTDAGNLLKQMLAMGSSKPWPDALEVITGQRTMDATGILDYFKPLQIWLEKENKKNKAFIGWKRTKRMCTRTRQEFPRRFPSRPLRQFKNTITSTSENEVASIFELPQLIDTFFQRTSKVIESEIAQWMNNGVFAIKSLLNL